MADIKQPPAFADLSFEYWKLFLECKINPDKLPEIKHIVTTIIVNRTRYERATSSLVMPWWFLALVHAMERKFSFTKHLYNGQPLNGRVSYLPGGRPIGNPRANPREQPSAKNPYSWEESAEDCMRLKGLNTWKDWSIRAALYNLEAYNGWGYRLDHPEVLTPYLWSFTDKYAKGKYTVNRVWDENLVSSHAGAAAILRHMVDSGLVYPIDYVGDFPVPSTTTMTA